VAVAVPVAPAVPDRPVVGEDWRHYQAEGDALVSQRQRDAAVEAYLSALDLATDGRAVTAVEVAALCRKAANLQIGLGSPAEARQTLEKGRAALKKIAGGGAERQKAIEQIENQIRTLPRD
jgi:hypothetical protein